MELGDVMCLSLPPTLSRLKVLSCIYHHATGMVPASINLKFEHGVEHVPSNLRVTLLLSENTKTPEQKRFTKEFPRDTR